MPRAALSVKRTASVSWSCDLRQEQKYIPTKVFLEHKSPRGQKLGTFFFKLLFTCMFHWCSAEWSLSFWCWNSVIHPSLPLITSEGQLLILPLPFLIVFHPQTLHTLPFETWNTDVNNCLLLITQILSLRRCLPLSAVKLNNNRDHCLHHESLQEKCRKVYCSSGHWKLFKMLLRAPLCCGVYYAKNNNTEMNRKTKGSKF